MIKTIIKQYNKNIVLIIVIIIDTLILLGRLYYYNNRIIFGNTILKNAYTNNVISNGWGKVGNDWYYCKGTTIVTDEIIEWDNKLYYLDKKGKLLKNKIAYKIKDNYYNIDTDGMLTLISN